jgi:hypothetical protein
VTVKLTRQQIQDAIPYEANIEIDRNLEVDMHNHYGLAGYWENHPVDTEPGAYD